MRLLQDISGVTFTVTLGVEEKKDANGKQRFNKDGAPMWQVQCMALDKTGGEMLKITVAGERPNVSLGQIVVPVELEALPWNQNGRSGVAFRAKEIRSATSSVSKAA